MDVNCDQCGHMFEVPVERTGEAVDCPDCNASVSVPSEAGIRIKWGDVKPNKGPGSTGLSLLKPESPKEEQSSEIPPSEVESQSEEPDVIHLNCPSCDQHLEAPVELSGTVIDCPSCDGKVPISGEPPVSQSAPDIKVECPSCEQYLAVPKELGGQTIDCPSCSSNVAVPSEVEGAGREEEYDPFRSNAEAGVPRIEEVPVPVPPGQVIIPAKAVPPTSHATFWQLIGRAFILNGSDFWKLGVMIAVSFIVQVVFVLLSVTFCLTFPFLILIIIGYPSWFFTYGKLILNYSAEGETELPPFPDILEDKYNLFIVGFFQCLAIGIVSFFPVGIGIKIESQDFVIVALSFSAFITPLLAFYVAMFDSIVGMFRVDFIYRGLKVFFVHYCLIYFISTSVMIATFMVLPILGGMGIMVIYAFPYPLIVVCRLLGFMYYTNRTKLRWLGER